MGGGTGTGGDVSDLVELREALVIRPGDTLIIRVERITGDQVKAVRDALMQRLPQLTDVLVISAAELAVFRPNEVQV